MAIMLAILFSYQKLASSAFSLVYCVPVADDKVLYVDGGVKCMQNWQIAVLFYIYLCIVPFGFYIAIAPSLLKANQINIGQYFVGCLFPVPMVLIRMLLKVTKCSKKANYAGSDTTDKQITEATLVYRMLQGPYREYSHPSAFSKKYISVLEWYSSNQKTGFDHNVHLHP